MSEWEKALRAEERHVPIPGGLKQYGEFGEQ